MVFNHRTLVLARFTLILALLSGMLRTAPARAASYFESSGNSADLSGQTDANPVVGVKNAVRLFQASSNFPTVIATLPKQGDVLLNNPSTISVQFSSNMLADGTAFAVNRASNYLLMEDGADGKFQTTSCVNRLEGDDTSIAISTVTYNPTNFTSTLNVPAWPSLNQASYQLLVCASTRITDTAGNRLGDGSDPVIRFMLRKDVDLYPYSNLGGGSGKAVGIGDFNHDGLTDVVMSTSSQVLVYLKDNQGNLGAPAAYPAGSRSDWLDVADLNNDGWTDVVTADFSSNTISVFLQQANGTLAPRVTYATSINPNAIAVGDISGDRRTDVVVSHSNAPSIGIFIQTPNGTLAAMTSYSSPDAGGDDIAIGDVNNDGRNDVVKMNGQGLDADLSVYLQNTSGTLETAIPYSLGCTCIGGGIDIGDVTGDGLSDVVMSYGGNRPNSKIAVFAQGQNGQLQPAVIYDAYDIPLPIEIADIDLDGALDVLVLHGGWRVLGVFLQKDGLLQPENLYTIPNINRFGPQALSVGDINQDGALDAAISDDIYGLTVLYYHKKPAPQVIMGGNTWPVDGKEVGTEPGQLTVQFDQPMKADGSASSADHPSNYLLVEDGSDNNFQTSSCVGGQEGDDALISVDHVAYDPVKYFSTLSIHGGVSLGLGRYRLLVCGTTSIEDVAGVKLNGGLYDGSITFTVWPNPHKISGNAGVGGAALSYSDGSPRMVIADGIGDYSFQVSDPWTGTVTPSKANYTFTPASKNYTAVSTGLLNENYTAALITFTISGNTGIGPALVYYSPSGYTSSDENGNYSLNVPMGWTGIVSVGGVPGYRFLPESRSYSNLQSNQSNQDFTPQRVYVISGNAGAAGVTLSYVDGTPKTVVAANNGSYSFQVPEHWSGTVTPSKSSHIFTPPSRTYNDVVGDQLSQNFSSTVLVTNANDGGLGSLRQAITDATPGATIYFDPALAGQAITLASQLDINKNLTIDGANLNPRISISGNNAVRIFSIGPGYTVSLRSLILKDGRMTGTSFIWWGGAVYTSTNTQLTITDVKFSGNSAYNAGALFVDSSAVVSILASEFSSNSAQETGGAIYAKNDITIKDSVFTSNQAVSGGAVAFDGMVTYLIENNTFLGNQATIGGGAISMIQAENQTGTIRRNLFSGNIAGAGGAIKIEYYSSLPTILDNNTFYANHASDVGGAILSYGRSEMRNNTFSHNQADRAGGSSGASLYLSGAYTTLHNNILANSTGGAECTWFGANLYLAGGNNLIENGSAPCSTLPGTIISDPMLGSLQNNGGSTQTMALLTGSPAIDTGDNAACPTTDQRGIARPQGSACDMGAFEYVPPPPTPTFTPSATPPPPSHLYLSLLNSQTVGGVAAADEDILRFDGQSWGLLFDGSDVGVGSPDLFAFAILDADTILMAFNANVTVNGLSITPRDVVRFDATSLGSTTAGTFSMYLHGIDVGLDTSNENIDGLDLLPDGRVLISTSGTPSVPAGIEVRDEDILAFTPTSLGNNTSGSWARYLDGSSVGLADTGDEDIDALDLGPNGTLYLSTFGNFAVAGLSGADEDIFTCKFPTESACTYSSAVYFDGSTLGLDANDVDGLDFFASGAVPTAVPTNTPTATSTRTPTATNTAGASPTHTFTATATPSRTPTSSSGSPLTFIAVADARVSQASPTSNYGTATTLQADGGSGSAQTSFITFNASGLTGAIQSAKLRVFCTTNGTANGPAAYLAKSNWPESGAGGITWNTQPVLLSGAFDNKGSIAANSWVEYDVTALVTGDGTYTFALVADSSDGVVFSSREGTMPPQLVVTFGSGSATPTLTSTNPPSTTNTPTATATPTFTATQPSVSSATPTPTFTPSNTPSAFTLTALADTYVNAGSPTTNYGSSTTLRADASPDLRSYLRFDVQGLNGTVTRATLRVFANSASGQGCNASSVSDNSWSESTLNFNNAPPLGSALGASGSFGAGAWISIDVTAYITGNGTYNLALTTPSSTAVSFASRESGANAPQLIIETAP